MSTGSSKTPQTAVAGCTVSWRPSAGERPSPLRASSSGVCTAPAATMTASARTVSGPAAVLASTPTARVALARAARAAVLDEDPLGPRARDDLRASLQSAREVDLAHVLLGARRAAEGAHAGAATAARVATQVAAVPAEPLCAAPDRRGVATGQLRCDLRDAERRLDALEQRVREAVDPVLGAPAVEHRGRRAEAGARVDEGRAAGAAAERQHQRRSPDRGDLPAGPVEPRQRVARAPGRVRAPAHRALLEHDDAQPTLRQLRGRDGAAGAAADDADVSVHGAPARAALQRRRSSSPRRSRA